ncbi:MAG: TetR/AcrR family transcriptional regulator [Deltaproteobacteria bacterium]|jgi:AcrR family transcriptional regulator|nr:TetR/AcrR family transcriptional regulator [Deltaproteobacteria bacterium]
MREKILQVSLSLFAKDGYEGVSVSDISEKLNITKGALYRHFQGKRDIYDAILTRVEEHVRPMPADFGLPRGPLTDANREEYRRADPSALKLYAMAAFRHWTENEFARSFRQLLVMEQFHDERAAGLMSVEFVSGILGYLGDLLGEMSALTSVPAQGDLLALEFYAPLHMLMGFLGATIHGEKLASLASRHVDAFFDRWLR